MKKIQLTRPHVHAGVTYSADDVIDVTDADAAYLIRYQIGRAVKSAVKKSDKSDKSAEPEKVEQPGDNTDNPPSADGETENQNKGEQ